MEVTASARKVLPPEGVAPDFYSASCELNKCKPLLCDRIVPDRSQQAWPPFTFYIQQLLVMCGCTWHCSVPRRLRASRPAKINGARCQCQRGTGREVFDRQAKREGYCRSPTRCGFSHLRASGPNFASFDPGARAPRACIRIATSIPRNLSTAILGGNPKKLDSQSHSGVLSVDAT